MIKFKKRSANEFKSKFLNLNNIITETNKIEKPNIIKHPNPILYNNKHDKYFWEFDTEPSIWVSVLIPCHNTKREFIQECLKSLKEQIGNFGIELVWINDGSNEENTNIQVELLRELEFLKNFKLIYNRTIINKGISFCLHQGLLLCSNELVLRMDSDDIMINNRIQSQIDYMNKNLSCVLCGSNVISFEIINGIKSEINRSHFKNILTWNEYRSDPKDHFLNHPTLCFRKSAILKAGNYRKNFRVPFEDLELELRVLKMFGSVHNISECLVLYRSHENQISIKLCGTNLNKQLITILIRETIKN
jgi:glycosyltransferase involved in cell wall biosynthesis